MFLEISLQGKYLSQIWVHTKKVKQASLCNIETFTVRTRPDICKKLWEVCVVCYHTPGMSQDEDGKRCWIYGTGMSATIHEILMSVIDSDFNVYCVKMMKRVLHGNMLWTCIVEGWHLNIKFTYTQPDSHYIRYTATNAL